MALGRSQGTYEYLNYSWAIIATRKVKLRSTGLVPDWANNQKKSGALRLTGKRARNEGKKKAYSKQTNNILNQDTSMLTTGDSTGTTCGSWPRDAPSFVSVSVCFFRRKSISALSLLYI
jgi:hypothetical protein